MTQHIMDSTAFLRSIDRIVHEILEHNDGAHNLAIIGVLTRGADIGMKISQRIEELEEKQIPYGSVDITLYRDDFRELRDVPQAKGSDIQFDSKAMDIILVDDVLYTGRTVRSAIDVILDFGRPRSIQLAVLVDRDGRELPIQPDYVGRKVEVRPDEYVRVCTQKTDGKDEVLLVKHKD